MDGIKMFHQFVALHKAQLESSAVPQHLWESLYRKLSVENFDAGEVFQLMLIEYDDDDEDEDTDDADEDEAEGEEQQANESASLPRTAHRPVFALHVVRDEGLQANNPNAIYLIDHAWTFRLNGTAARQQLEQHERLADRLCAITGVDIEDEERVDKLLARMWRYVQHYSVAPPPPDADNNVAAPALSDEDRLPIWYIMDEVGSAVQHSDQPNCRVVPFLHLNTQTTFSLLFPTRDCACGEPMQRDFVEHVPTEAPERAALLLPWREADFRAHSFAQAEPAPEYFTSGHVVETLPLAENGEVAAAIPLKVYAEYEAVRRHLTAPEFQLVESEADADILWLTRHFKDFAELQRSAPHRRINQFPFEYVITIKDLLAISCRRTAGAAEVGHEQAPGQAPPSLETLPRWLPATFNLKTELLPFVAYFQRRASCGLDNHWIVKPWNLARSLDTHITADVAQILRLPATGPKIAQKYIERPVLFRRTDLLDAAALAAPAVKFDVRYVLLLRRVQPLEAYVHRKFYLRFANRAFALSGFDDYERHFTVMNYRDEAVLRHLKCDDFLQQWAEQYPEHPWSRVEDDICGMLHEMLVCATERAQPPCAIAASPQSRALYAADIMLEWSPTSGPPSVIAAGCGGDGERRQGGCIQPKLLEVNWTPDCQRACDYYPDFFNDIFRLLFLDVANEESFRLLKANNS